MEHLSGSLAYPTSAILNNSKLYMTHKKLIHCKKQINQSILSFFLFQIQKYPSLFFMSDAFIQESQSNIYFQQILKMSFFKVCYLISLSMFKSETCSNHFFCSLIHNCLILKTDIYEVKKYAILKFLNQTTATVDELGNLECIYRFCHQPCLKSSWRPGYKFIFRPTIKKGESCKISFYFSGRWLAFFKTYF